MPFTLNMPKGDPNDTHMPGEKRPRTGRGGGRREKVVIPGGKERGRFVGRADVTEDADATAQFSADDLRAHLDDAASHAEVTGAADESLKNELHAAAWSPISGEEPLEAAEAPEEEVETVSSGALHAARSTAEDFGGFQVVGDGEEGHEAGYMREAVDEHRLDAGVWEEHDDDTDLRQSPAAPTPTPARVPTFPGFEDPSEGALQEAMRSGAPVIFPQAPATTERIVGRVPVHEQPTDIDLPPERAAAAMPAVDLDAATAPTDRRGVAWRPDAPTDRVDSPLRVSPDATQRFGLPEAPEAAPAPVERAPDRALNAVRANNDGRLRRLLATKPWMRRVAVGLAAGGALLAGAFGWNKLHERQPDLSGAVDTAGEHEKAGSQDKTPDNLPVENTEKKTVEAFRVIKNGEGVSQGLLGAGVKFDKMMNALNGLTIKIGDKSASLKDTFVIARGGELGMKVNTDTEGNVASVTFTHADGSQMTPSELPKYLAVADWRAEKAHREARGSVGSATPLSDAELTAYAQSYYGPNARSVDLHDLGSVLNGGGNVDEASTPAAPDFFANPWTTTPDAPVASSPWVGAPSNPSDIWGYKPGTSSKEDAVVNIDNPWQVESRSVLPDAPTVRIERRADVPAVDMNAVSMRGGQHGPDFEKAPYMPQDFERHMESLDDALDAARGRTLHMGSLEFRRIGLTRPEYQVRYDGEKAWIVLDQNMMARLYDKYGVDFRDPSAMRSLSKLEFASVLPDGNPMKESLREGLVSIITLGAQFKNVDVNYFKKEYKMLTGHDFEGTGSVASM